MRHSISFALAVIVVCCTAGTAPAEMHPGGDSATFDITSTSSPWPTNGWEVSTPAEQNMDALVLEQARSYALTGGGSGLVTRGGKQVMAWGDQEQRYNLKSTSKSIGVTALGLAMQDGLLVPDDVAQQFLPGIGLPPDENADTGWLDDITVRQLATHTAGFDKQGGYTALLFAPGTAWSYSDGSANWLADILTTRYGIDLKVLMFDRVFGVLGIQPADLVWRNHAYREQLLNGIPRREFGSGIRANVDAMARIGYLYLRNGYWDGQVILPAAFITEASRPVPGVTGLPVLDAGSFATASDHYGLLWWNNGDGTLADVPTDAFWSWGLQDSVIVVIPSLDIVAARAGDGWRSGWDADYAVIEPFLSPIVQSVMGESNAAPQVNAGADQNIVLPTNTATLDGTVTDDGLPASGTLTTQWSVHSGPGVVTFGDAAAVDTLATFPVEGTYVLSLTADDGALSSSDNLTVTVTPVPVNQAPQVDAGDELTIRLPTDTLMLNGTVEDDGLPGGSLTIQWSMQSGPAAVTFGDTSAVDSLATFPAAGTYVLQLTADDGALSNSDNLTVTVQAASVLTQVRVTPSSVTLAPGASRTFVATGEDQYGDALGISTVWSATGGGIDAGGNYSAGAADGVYTVTASDGPINGQATVTIQSSVGGPAVAYLQFDGANDVVTVQDDNTLDITTAITVEAWIRPDTISSGKVHDRILYKGTNYDLSIATGRNGCGFGTTGDVKWRARIGGSSARICGGVLTPGVWHHVAGSYDGSQFVLYVDGAVVASAPLSGAIKANRQALYLGNQSDGSRPFDGSLDEVRIWNRALGAAEVALNRNIELGGSEVGLVAYYRFNAGSGQIIADQTAFSNHGVLGSSPATENNDPQWGTQ